MAKEEPIEFTASGKRMTLTRDQVLRSVKGVVPSSLRTHAVVVEGKRYPVKDVVAAATGLDPLDFNTNQARRWLQQLGFEVERIRGTQRKKSDD